MKSVHHHPDGDVFVRIETVTYGDTPENFEIDFGYPFPPLPEGMFERIYDQGRRHALMSEKDGDVHTTGGPMPWPEGDQVINDIAGALASQKSRRDAEAAAREELMAKGGFNAY
jgi:hypothetical protein